MRFLRMLALAGLALSSAVPCVEARPSGTSQDIVQTAVTTPGFSTLVSLLQQADLVTTLQGPGPFTVFAPTDAAFAALDPNLVAYLTNPANVADLRAVLLYHVVPGSFPAAQVVTSPYLTTANGQRALIRVTNNTLTIDAAPIAATDILCTNGIIHVLDGVMQPNLNRIPATAASTSRFDTLLAAVGAAGLAQVLDSDGPFTVLAPTDTAFAQLPAGTVETLLLPQNQALLASILKYHVLPGRVYADRALSEVRFTTLQGQVVEFNTGAGFARVNYARILKTDLDTANGVIHVINKVLLPGVAGGY